MHFIGCDQFNSGWVYWYITKNKDFAVETLKKIIDNIFLTINTWHKITFVQNIALN